ncbi:ABC-F family ATP-binding cassette domain-containing protein [Pseudokineococcus sp. 1T1Z-3]|uniref:ABC-F family ATP-binding cassette domain-containing protein n=1 Tax=Pseudokineococcus sp. 1T1Z-3 TaxID=3132745 RepID=UPI0030A63DE0
MTAAPARPGAGRPADHLAVDRVDRRFPDRLVLRDVSLAVPAGARVALVGENGAGKSTLLRVVAGLDEPDAGTVRRPDRLRLVQQVLPFADDATLAEVLDDAVEDARGVERELADVAEALTRGGADPERTARRYDEALAAATLADVWSLDARVERVLAGLGLAGVSRSRRVGDVSGGQRTRLSLAAALVARPTALLLDEPTNHLDDEGLTFLAAELGTWAGPVLFASHDRRFLDDVATRVVDLDPVVGPHRGSDDVVGVQGTSYRGGYSAVLRSKADGRRRWEEQHAREQERLAELRHEVAVGARDVMHTSAPKTEARAAKKFYADRAATVVARRVRSARSRLEELERTQVAVPPPVLGFRGLGPPRRRREQTLVTLEDVAVAGRLRPTSVHVGPRARLLLDGPNGCGKSTLVEVLAGRLPPDDGDRRAPAGLRVGVLAQDVRWEAPALTAAETYRRAVGAGARPLADSGLLPARDVGRPVSALSVGQQRRLALAVLVADPPELLVLDEPTNHLSLTLAEELEAALADYPGAVVLASHDRWLRERWEGERVALGPPAGGSREVSPSGQPLEDVG